MIKKLLSEKQHYTLSECAQGCDCTEKDILQFASEGNINLQANLAYTEGDLYVINDSIDTPKELKLRSWKGYQTLTPNFCEKLLRNFDQEVSITSIVATQEERDEFNLNYNDTVEISLDPSIIVSGDPLDPLGSNIQKDYQYITTKDVWISKEEYERLRLENKDDHGKLDRNTDETMESNKEELMRINVSTNRRRKQHTAYIANRIKLGKERGESWESYKQLANDSIGKQQVELPGNGKIYLRRVRKDPEQEILYSHEAFDHDETENLPVGVLLLKKTAFDTAWTYIAKKGNIKET
jgi:hypothetical protein